MSFDYTGSFSGSFFGDVTASNGLISSSAQVTDSLPVGVISSSAQTIANLPSGVVSSSAQSVTNLPSGVISSSNQISYPEIVNKPVTISAFQKNSIVANNRFREVTFPDISSSVSTRLTDLENATDETGSDSQTLSISGDQLTIAGGNTITIPTGSDIQTLTFDSSTNALSIADGNSVDLSSLSGGGGDGAGTALTASDEGIELSKNVRSIDFVGNIVTATNSGNALTVTINTSSTAGIIGDAEDGDYTDGLFTDFVNATPIGTAIDRFNEILKALSPSPAPNLDDIDFDASGVAAKLSFGSSNTISGYSNVTTDGGYTSAVDSNGSITVSGDKRGIFDTLASQPGTLNEDVSADGVTPNYPANSFGDADQGTLTLEVNGTDVLVMALSASGDSTGSLNSNNSQFLVSATRSAFFDDGTELDTFKSRTGTYTVSNSDQRLGYNYARVKHTLAGGTQRVTNFVDWIVDTDSNALSNSNAQLVNYSGSGTNKISGVDYHTAGQINFTADFSNVYRNVYDADSNAITFSDTNLANPTGVNITGSGVTDSTGGSGTTHSLPALNNTSNCEQQDIHISSTSSFNNNLYAPNTAVDVEVVVTHPHKSSTTADPADFSGSLIYKTTSNTDTDVENFKHESNRLVTGSFDAQSEAHSGYAWDSAQSLDPYQKGLLVVPFDDGRVVGLRSYSSNGISNGDFSSIANGPAGNPDYSGVTAAELRTHYFKLRNTTTSDLANFSLVMKGSGTGVRANTAVGSMSGDDFKLEFKIPNRTGWADAVNDDTRSTPANSDGEQGSLAWSDPSGGGQTITLTVHSEIFGGTLTTTNISGGEYIVFRITARADWTGYIDEMEITNI